MKVKQWHNTYQALQQTENMLTPNQALPGLQCLSQTGLNGEWIRITIDCIVSTVILNTIPSFR